MKPYYPVDMKWPISQKFGVNKESYPQRNGHPGIDYACPVGCELYSALDGKVTSAGYREAGGYGREVFITSGNWTIIYGHLSEVDVKVGDTVKRGQVIGVSGGAVTDPLRGNSTGPHLHFEVRDTRQPQQYPLIGAVDPEQWLQTEIDSTSPQNVNSSTTGLNTQGTPVASPSESPSGSDGIVTVYSDHVNVRKEPSTKSQALFQAVYGQDYQKAGDEIPGTGQVVSWQPVWVKAYIATGLTNGERYLE